LCHHFGEDDKKRLMTVLIARQSRNGRRYVKNSNLGSPDRCWDWGLVMDLTEKRYWPFDVLPPERRSEQHCREVDFLETAYDAGYQPYLFHSQNFGATAGERTGEIIYRGFRGKHWEVCLSPVGFSAHLDHFVYAAAAVLHWLQGVEWPEILEHVRGHLFIDRVTAPGFALYGRNGKAEDAP
jgi:hypothetical protein